MKRLMAGVLSLFLLANIARAEDLAGGFAKPPAGARPWVYWFWLNGNITREGITADLEAMSRVGVGGVLIMEVDQGAPTGPAGFGRPEWRDLFKHVCAEANRLGIEVNMNNDAGWCGSGGPWIKPEQAMQKLTWSEVIVEGPKRIEQALEQPKTVGNYYRDIAVLAFPTPANDWRIGNVEAKAAFNTGKVPPRADWPATQPDAAIPRDGVRDITTGFREGKLSWDVPAGKWTILRIGHTLTGKDNHPAPEAGRGLESDKLSREATDAMFDGLMGKLIADIGPLAGKTLVATHIDSWETGSQNWTGAFRTEFTRRRGYDPMPLIPAITGRVVGDVETTERFLWDVRQTVNDLLLDNYAGRFRELAKKHGLRLSIEAYDAPCDDMSFAGRCDEPMAEFWSYGGNTDFTITEMTSAAHTYGAKIIGAEAFTATDAEKWLAHPGSIKQQGDFAFCEGINRFVFHRYALQPWIDRRPGMSMGPWGLHYERTQTWWEQSKPWHEYLARCQYLLQRGLFVADICYLSPEGSPNRFVPPANRAQYSFDGCTPEVVMSRMSVEDGRLVLPDGMSYRVLVLPDVPTMTPGLLKRVGELAEQGATIIGKRPLKSPSLSNYPACDDELKRLAAELWSKGRIIDGKTPQQVLAERGIEPDVRADSRGLKWIHRNIDGTHVYFVSNQSGAPLEAICSFRVGGTRPELWRPMDGSIERPAVYDADDKRTRLPIALGPAESVFVVFRPDNKIEPDRVVRIEQGKMSIDATQEPKRSPAPAQADVTRTFTITCWAKPSAEIALPPQENHGVAGVHQQRNDLLYAAPGHEVWGARDAGAGISVGTNGVVVYEHGESHFAPVLVHAAKLDGWTHIAVVYRDGVPLLYLNGKEAAVGAKSEFTVHPAVGAEHGRIVQAFTGESAKLAVAPSALSEQEIRARIDSTQNLQDRQAWPSLKLVATERGIRAIGEAGEYTLTFAGGERSTLSIPRPGDGATIDGPWDLAFSKGCGAPERVRLATLLSWSRHEDAGVRYFSGTATYRKRFNLASKPAGRQWLDLGDVQVIAEVKLNGKALGTLWMAPYRIDITDAVKDGENELEIAVTNLWPNRMIGDERLPEDSERNDNGTLKSWPKWLDEGKPSPTGRFTFTSWRLWKKDSPLLESGMLGPVKIDSISEVELPRRASP